MTACYQTGVIHGRFQVLHNDHLRYLLAGKALCDHLVVGITNPDPTLSRDEQADPKRNSVLANPLTYFERLMLVRRSLEEAGISPSEFSVVPLPINLPELYRYYTPVEAVFFLSIYDDWGRRKLGYFRELGLKTHVLWEVHPEEKGLSATEVRKRMMEGKAWEAMVPAGVAALLKEWGIPARLRDLARKEG